MSMIIYQPVKVDRAAFVQFWSARYIYTKEELYDKNIGRELTEARILELFTWKNGTPLSKRKHASVMRNYVAKSAELARIPQNESAAKLLSNFSKGGAIWRIFWLHCWQPRRFPIYDQHVHRAMRFFQAGIPEEIGGTDRAKVRSYLDSYMQFHSEFNGLDPRLVDKALWAFGKFLNENNFPLEPVG
jgi:hypothetical protein